MKLINSVRRSTAKLVFNHLTVFTQLLPHIKARRKNVDTIKNVPYINDGTSAHLLDILRPKAIASHPMPVVLYLHGGGFTLCSKETHHSLASMYASHGYLVFNINYRLAPKHQYPSAHADAAKAYEWVVKHCTQYGGDKSRIIIAGESAGGNLASSLMLATTNPSNEEWANALWELNHPPAAVQAICPFVQVSNPDHLRRQSKLSNTAITVAGDLAKAYLGPNWCGEQADTGLADPKLFANGLNNSARPLPPTFLPIGTADTLLYDTREFSEQLDKLGCDTSLVYYPKEPHAFHAIPWKTKQAKQYWQDCFDFLARHNLKP